MRREYDFSKARRNPYASRLKQSVTIRLDSTAVAYFKRLAAELEIPYQTLINLYLRDCAASGRKLALKWKPARRGRSLTSAREAECLAPRRAWTVVHYCCAGRPVARSLSAIR
ncbi:MAG: hypothetical protein DMD49_12740 [Gemmatimonadetes bacterium]|nr:MAG: hypothetical protein DMD49_12740 [Gemmatimonadota bacterium]